jgi:serine/threonine-protein kinase
VLELFDQMLQPLAAAHRAGIVHRDLKPENVFLAKKRDGTEVVKILDFGIARDLAGRDTVTQAGTAMGTPHYMSPEQAMSARDATFTTDVWALGVMLYETLTGAPPFSGDTIATIVVEICTKPHRPLGLVLPDVPPALAALVDRCLEKDATKRPASAADLLVALRQARGTSAPSLPTSVPTREMAPTMMASMPSTPGMPAHATAPIGGPTPPPSSSGFPATAAMPMTPPPASAMPPTSASPLPLGTPPSFPTPVASPGSSSVPSFPGVPSTPGVAPASGSGRPRWVVPVVLISALGCLGALGVFVLFFGLAVIGAMVGANREVDGELAYSDTIRGNGAFGDSFDYSFSSGEHVLITLTSPDFDTVLVLRTPSGREIINDDEGFGSLNSRIDMVAQESGGYEVTATSYRPRATGRYHLSVQTP